ncbi:hypothetical protein KR044_004702 [Drosophila immigrans]|nr:hypothetical protein KR044_004702 [Drosophila immigrans]
MDQKRAMLYPQVDFNTPPSAPLQTPTAAGPIEAPPSYDVAIAAHHAAAPEAPAPVIVVNAQPLPQQQQQLEPTIVPSGNFDMCKNHIAKECADSVFFRCLLTAPTNLGPNPCRVMCPACGVQKTTRMTHTANARTHLAAALICLVGWCVCACFVPYCMNSCRTGNHYCRKCNTFLGVYNPKGVK